MKTEDIKRAAKAGLKRNKTPKSKALENRAMLVMCDKCGYKHKKGEHK